MEADFLSQIFFTSSVIHLCSQQGTELIWYATKESTFDVKNINEYINTGYSRIKTMHPYQQTDDRYSNIWEVCAESDIISSMPQNKSFCLHFRAEVL